MTILQVLAAILAALLLLAAAAGSGPAAAQAVPSLGDASITARVERALDNERSLEHAHISVHTRGGMVAAPPAPKRPRFPMCGFSLAGCPGGGISSGLLLLLGRVK